MQYIDNLYLSRLLEKSGKSQVVSCGLKVATLSTAECDEIVFCTFVYVINLMRYQL